jgi:pseudaminic acid synthase
MEFKLDKKDKRHIFIIAEISANHAQDFNTAVDLIKKAKECGADAVKFQAYTPDTMTLDAESRYFRIRHPKWASRTLYQLYKKAYTPWGWFKRLKKVSDDLGIIFFATVFDKSSVDLLERLKAPIYKISSFELTDLPLIEYTAKTKKPLILSGGMGTVLEIKEAINVAKQAGAKDIIILKCTSGYPARSQDMNLRTIPDMRKLFKCPVGLSDHTLGIGVSIAAVSLGAEAIEKHFTLSRKIKTPDDFFSIEPGEFKALVENIRMVEKAMGKVYYGLAPEEKNNRVYRRSLFATKDIKKGEIFTEENIRSIRPAYGIKPEYFQKILGKSASKDIKRGTPLNWILVSDK